IALLDGLNPDAFIVRANAERAAAGRDFDAAYAASLSADAVPDLVAALSVLKPGDRRTLEAALLRRWGQTPPADWRTWNWARSEARRAVEERRAGPDRIAGVRPPLAEAVRESARAVFSW